MDAIYQVFWSDLGVVAYERFQALQRALALRAEEGPGYILFLEHPPTITLGYSLKGDEGRSAIRSSAAELKAAGVGVVEVDRGGKATFHGPGQLVCYPILSLKKLRLGVKRYVGKLQLLLLRALAELGVEADLDPRYPGVWTRQGKIAAVGIRVSERVTTHGFALNVDPDLSMFRHIVPCGITDRPVTSLAAMGLRLPSRSELVAVLVRGMAEELRLEMVSKEAGEIWSALAQEEA